MTKYLMQVQIMQMGGGEPITLEDTETYGGASAAWAQLTQGKDVHIKAPDGSWIFMPFHAIAFAGGQIQSSQVEDPVNEFCQEDDGGSDSDPDSDPDTPYN